MSDFRKNLNAARDEHQSLQFDGDLATLLAQEPAPRDAVLWRKPSVWIGAAAAIAAGVLLVISIASDQQPAIVDPMAIAKQEQEDPAGNPQTVPLSASKKERMRYVVRLDWLSPKKRDRFTVSTPSLRRTRDVVPSMGSVPATARPTKLVNLPGVSFARSKSKIPQTGRLPTTERQRLIATVPSNSTKPSRGTLRLTRSWSSVSLSLGRGV